MYRVGRAELEVPFGAMAGLQRLGKETGTQVGGG